MLAATQIGAVPCTFDHWLNPHLQACAALWVRAQQAHDDTPAASTDALRQGLAAPCLHIEQCGCQVIGLARVLHTHA